MGHIATLIDIELLREDLNYVTDICPDFESDWEDRMRSKIGLYEYEMEKELYEEQLHNQMRFETFSDADSDI